MVFRNLLAEGGVEAALSCSRCRRHDPTRRQIRHCRGKALDVQARREKDLLARNKALSDCSGRCGSYGCERAEAIGSS